MAIGNNKRKKFRQRILLMVATILFMTMSLSAHAADMKILSTIVFDGDVYIYIRGISELQQDSVVQIGNNVCQKEQLVFASMADSGISIHTLVLIDNSKSIPKERHADIRAILEELVSSAGENEQFKIGVFSDQISYLCDYTNNKEDLINVIEGIDYNDQDTYMSDVLYDVISELRLEDTNAYTRILIFADGADDNAIGFTNDEVRSFVGKNAYPVYTIGIPTKNNSSKLEVMFSFSRASGSEYFLLDGSISNEEIVSCLTKDRSGICLKISPDESLKDGSNKKILLKLISTGGGVELTTDVDMPFGSVITEMSDQEEKIEDEEEEKDTELPVLKPSEEINNDKKENTTEKIFVLVIVPSVIVVLAALVVAVLIVKHKRKKPQSIPVQDDVISTSVSGMTEIGEKTIIEGVRTYTDDARELWEKPADNYLVLKNLDNTNIMMKVPIIDKVHIGRSETQDIVIENDKKVSRAHCEIILRGELLYIADCNSANGTFYEGVRIYDETPIVSGGKIIIGAHRYCIELVKQSRGREIDT